MQCTSVSIFGLEAAALYLYYNRGSVVTCYDGSLEMCGGGRWDIGNNDLFPSTVLLSGRRPASIQCEAVCQTGSP